MVITPFSVTSAVSRLCKAIPFPASATSATRGDRFSRSMKRTASARTWSTRRALVLTASSSTSRRSLHSTLPISASTMASTSGSACPRLQSARSDLISAGATTFPQRRGDTTAVFSNTLNYLRGRHSFKFGGEARRFYNNNSNKTTGTFGFANPTDFLNGNANAFTVTVGDVASSIGTGALGFFTQDNYKLTRRLTLELGFRYDWFMSPTERYDRFVTFDQRTGSLVRFGPGLDPIYDQGNKNFQPRVGFAWDPFGNGKTSVRGAYAILADQPVTNVVTGLAANPPLASPMFFTGPIRLDNANTVARAALAPARIDPNFDNAYVQSYNLNVQREITPTLGVMAGYFGSKGTHLRISRNINPYIDQI